MQTRSLRHQLLRWLLLPFALTFLIGATVACFFALRAAMNTYDLGLMDSALDLSRQMVTQLISYSKTMSLPLRTMAMAFRPVN